MLCYLLIRLKSLVQYILCTTHVQCLMLVSSFLMLLLHIVMIITRFKRLLLKLFQRNLEHKDGDNSLMKKVFSLYLNFLQTSQSESLQKHVFASWRSFIKKVNILHILLKSHDKLVSQNISSKKNDRDYVRLPVLQVLCVTS